MLFDSQSAWEKHSGSERIMKIDFFSKWAHLNREQLIANVTLVQVV